jgi:hypothetical protein
VADNELCQWFAWRLGTGNAPTNGVSLLAAVTALLSVLMIAACGWHWIKEYAGLGKSVSTFAVCFGIVAAYYGILVACSGT